MRNIGFAVFSTTKLIVIGFFLMLLMLVWTTAAYAQSAGDQYGSPTKPVGPIAHVVSVLPDTGGPTLLVVAGVLVVGGTGLALLRRRASH